MIVSVHRKRLKNNRQEIQEAKERFRRNPVGAILGFEYCGPGTKLEGQKPKNKTDSVCKDHDEDYGMIDELAEQGIDDALIQKAIRKADNKMLKALEQVPDAEKRSLGYKFAKYGILGKRKLEDLGIIGKRAFAGRKKPLLNQNPGLMLPKGTNRRGKMEL